MEQETKLVKVERAMLPATCMQEVLQAGDMLARAGIPGVKNSAQGFFLITTCQQQGISIMEFLRTYHMTDKGPSMRADAMLAEFRNRGGKCKIIENSVTRAAAEFAFEGNVLTFAYTMDDANRTGDCRKGDGTLKETWAKRPDDMLWARMISRAVRRLCPEVNAGLYSPEEVTDFDDRPRAAAPITEEEALRRAKAVSAEPAVAPAIDYTLCPIGGDGYAGRPWAEFDAETLTAALASSDPALTVTHKAAIRLVISERKTQEERS